MDLPEHNRFAFFRNWLDLLKKHRELPGSNRVRMIFGSFSTGGKFLVFILLSLLTASFLSILLELNKETLVAVPAHGGSLNEGIIGSPRFVNPLLATADADRDIAILIYSGLMRANSDGTLLPDLASVYEISEDGLSYTFHIREGTTFHDGKPVTADDVLFTVEKAQDSVLKSPRRANWEGVHAEKIDASTVLFTLKQPYSPFLENTTIGILPKHLWENISDEEFPFSTHNIDPVGSGPYRVQSVKRDQSGVPTRYTLSAFKGYALGKPFLSGITLHFYPNEAALLEAYRAGDLDSVSGISSADMKNLRLGNGRIERAVLPRVFGLFFNQNQQALFANTEVRRALSLALDRERIVNEVFEGYASPITGPIPLGIVPAVDANAGNIQADAAGAEEMLAKSGWTLNKDSILEKKSKNKKQTLSFSIATANVPELRETAEIMKGAWEALGATVEVKIFEPGDLNQNVIRPRKYDALLFGEIVGRELDLYAFWHSSQRNDPGLNVAMYVNTKADKLLEEMRTTSDTDAKADLYRRFSDAIESDTPAVFAYAPDFIYIVPNSLHGVSLGVITTPSERFLDAYRWYIETDRVWSIFL